MTNSEKYFNGIMDIITTRQVYSEGCENLLRDKLRVERDIAMVKINVEETMIPELTSLIQQKKFVQSQLDSKLNQSFDDNIPKDCNILNEKINNLKTVLEQIAKGDELELLKAQDPEYMQMKK